MARWALFLGLLGAGCQCVVFPPGTVFRCDAGACPEGYACSAEDYCEAQGGGGPCAAGQSCDQPPGECYQPLGACLGDGGCAFSTRGGSCSIGQCRSGVCTPDAGPFPYRPANFDPDAITPGGDVIIDCPLTFNSSPGAGFVGSCGARPLPQISVQQNGDAGELVVLSARNLDVTSSGVLTLVGSRPVVLAAYGDATVEGAIRASSTRAGGGRVGAGARGSAACGAQAGQSGAGSNPGGGGGGAGAFTVGGHGGYGGGSSAAAGGGSPGAVGGGEIEPLRGGCPGGAGAAGALAPGGQGGGAVQLSAARRLRVTGRVNAGAQGGAGAAGDDPGGGGGGSGGAIVLEGWRLEVNSSAVVVANGGAGGGGCDDATGGPGDDGREDIQAASGGTAEPPGGKGGNGGALSLPAQGVDSANGGGGGGGAAGWIWLRHHSTEAPACSVTSTALSPQPQRFGCP